MSADEKRTLCTSAAQLRDKAHARHSLRMKRPRRVRAVKDDEHVRQHVRQNEMRQVVGKVHLDLAVKVLRERGGDGHACELPEALLHHPVYGSA
jgi:hypothetical protein